MPKKLSNKYRVLNNKGTLLGNKGMLLKNKGTLLGNKGMLLKERGLAEVRKKKMPHHGVQHPFKTGLFHMINMHYSDRRGCFC